MRQMRTYAPPPMTTTMVGSSVRTTTTMLKATCRGWDAFELDEHAPVSRSGLTGSLPVRRVRFIALDDIEAEEYARLAMECSSASR